jgi:HSP20 family protein
VTRKPGRRGEQTQGLSTGGAEDQGKLPAQQEGGERTRERPVFRPRIDIYETDQGLVLAADLPGVKPQSLDVQLENRILTIHGRVEDDAPEGYGRLYQEYEIGDFERQFTLAGDFDAEKVTANLENGVLRLTIPRAPEPQARRIDVKAR